MNEISLAPAAHLHLLETLARQALWLSSWTIHHPSLAKDNVEDIDFSTGSVALVGDAELDEGNVFGALLEGWKHDVRRVWWIIDYNRQSLDSIVAEKFFTRIDALFELVGWRVVSLKYGRRLEAAFLRPDGQHLREWIDACPNALCSTLVYRGAPAGASG